MSKITGFLEFERSDRDYEPVEERIQHWREFVLPLPDAENTKQAARCMDCGIPLLPHRLSGEQPDPGLIAARTFASCSPIPFQRRVFGPRAPLGRRRANLFLRHQLSIALRRAPPRLRLRGGDRAMLV